MVTFKVSLVQRFGESTPNAAHFECAYDALGAELSWRPTAAVISPARDGRDYEEIPYREFLAWATAQD